MPIRSFAISLILGYQRWLSPLLGTRCRFHPSCSRYMATAIDRFGLMPGLLLGTCRLLRCHPFNAGGFDAVAERFPRQFWRRNPDRSPPPAPEWEGTAETHCCHHKK